MTCPASFLSKQQRPVTTIFFRGLAVSLSRTEFIILRQFRPRYAHSSRIRYTHSTNNLLDIDIVISSNFTPLSSSAFSRFIFQLIMRFRTNPRRVRAHGLLLFLLLLFSIPSEPGFLITPPRSLISDMTFAHKQIFDRV